MAASGVEPGQSEPGPGHRVAILAATALFVAFLVTAFVSMSCPCDLDLYHHYARTARAESLPRLYAAHRVEYPPLAVALILGTEAVAARLPASAVPSRVKVYRQAGEDGRAFKFVYRVTTACSLLATWGAVVLLLRRHFAHESAQEWGERLFALTACLAPLGYVMLDRLDSVLAYLVVVALLLLGGRRHYAWSLVALAAAIAFKLVPVALVPVWLLASQPAAVLADVGSPRGLARFASGCAARGAILAALVVAFSAPVWLAVGGPSLDFFAFHAERGIEFQSNYAAPLTLFKHFGYPVRTSAGWGSAVLECSAAPVLAQLSAGLVGVSLLAGACVLFRTLARRPPALAQAAQAAQADGPLVLGHALWALLAFVLFNKTFSPQYAVWLVPLVAVVPLAGTRRRAFQLGYFGVAYLTMLIYPRHFAAVVGTPLASDPTQTTGATPLGTGLLLARLLLLVALAVLLGRELLRRARQRGSGTPGSAGAGGTWSSTWCATTG